jgi:uncharacterized membrane protein
MTAPPVAGPPVPVHPGQDRHPATPAQLQWLDQQLAAWRTEGLVDDATAGAIRGRYVVQRRVTLARIVLTLGACFVGLGLIWLVVSNLDQMSPLVRFLLMVAVWLGLVVAAEVLARRRTHSDAVPAPVVGAVRLLAAAAYGAVVFQAAQSLQVSSYGPILLGVWAAGALIWSYAVRAVTPLVLGVGLAASWFVWQVLDAGDSMLAAATAVATAGLVAASVGVLHAVGRRRGSGWRVLGTPWREIGAGLVLVGLFIAALPFGDDREVGVPAALWVGLAVGAVLAGAAILLGDRTDRLEVGLAGAALVVGVGLSLWRDPGGDLQDLSVGAWVRVFVAVAAYLAAASGYAVLGGMRDSARMTWFATASLVVFTTVQAFAVFAEILSGAALFLLVGVVLIGTGILADRGRRRLVREGKGAPA